MKEIIAALDCLANDLEHEGLLKEALQVDVYSNTIETTGKEAFLPQTPKTYDLTKIEDQVTKASKEIKEEFKTVVGYLEQYIGQLRSNDPTLDKLGGDFSAKLLHVIHKLRKELIGSKMFLNKLERDRGGLA